MAPSVSLSSFPAVHIFPMVGLISLTQEMHLSRLSLYVKGCVSL
ncbi:hypothetical protein C346_06756 [Cryptococcus neoformans D17-1]|nr:hypothetical protein C346_06756 [Cryptococcus neoformans var. grubii D17-1]